MQTQRLNITLPTGLAVDFRRSVPNRLRSKFIAQALKEKLASKKNLKKEWIKRLKANQKFYKKVAEEWRVTELEGWPD